MDPPTGQRTKARVLCCSGLPPSLRPPLLPPSPRSFVPCLMQSREYSGQRRERERERENGGEGVKKSPLQYIAHWRREGGGGGFAPFLSRSGRPPRAPNGRREEPYNRGLTTLSVHREGDQAFLFLCGALRGKARGERTMRGVGVRSTSSSDLLLFHHHVPFLHSRFLLRGEGVSHAAGRGEGKDGGRRESPGSKTEKEPRQGKAGSSSLEEEEEGAFWLLLLSRFSFPSALCTLALPVRLEASTAACSERGGGGVPRAKDTFPPSSVFIPLPSFVPLFPLPSLLPSRRRRRRLRCSLHHQPGKWRRRRRPPPP